MHRGYIKDWRKSLDHPLYKKPLIWHFWGYCLKKASHKNRDLFLGGKVVSIKKGSFVFGRKKASEETGLTERQIRTALKHLQKLQNLTIKTTNKYSIVSIINWDTYQLDENKNDQQNDQLPTSYRPATDHRQECKELKNDKNTDKIKNFVREFASYISSVHKNKAPKVTNSLISQSADTVDKLIRIDGFTLDYIKSVCRWAVKDDFYCTNFFSLAALRKKSSNGATKFANMAAKYDKQNGQPVETITTKTRAQLDKEIEELMK